MTITVGAAFDINPNLKIFLDTAEESISVDSSLETIGEVIDDVLIPGTTTLPGTIEYSLQDFHYEVTVDNAQTETYLVTGQNGDATVVSVNVATANALKGAFGSIVLDVSTFLDPIIARTLVAGGVYSYELQIKTYPAPGGVKTGFQNTLTNNLLAKMGTNPTDDITPGEAFEALLESI